MGNQQTKVMPIYQDIETTITGRQMVLKTAYWSDTEEFTLLHGSYCNDTGEAVPMIALDVISKCHKNQIIKAINKTIIQKAA